MAFSAEDVPVNGEFLSHMIEIRKCKHLFKLRLIPNFVAGCVSLKDF